MVEIICLCGLNEKNSLKLVNNYGSHFAQRTAEQIFQYL